MNLKYVIILVVLACTCLIKGDEITNKELTKREAKSDTLNSLDTEEKADEKLQLKKHQEDDDDDDDDHHRKKSREMNKEEREVLKKLATNFNFIHAFFASISVIVVSEIGDKTFFIAAIMAMKHPRITVYSGAMFALGLMTILSALLGNILTKVIPRIYTYYFSSFLFALFGFKMLREGLQMDNTDASEEYEEASTTLKESEEKSASVNGKDLETGGSTAPTESVPMTRQFIVQLRKYVSAIFLQAFVLTFLAEWGDRSQISTIILGARENMIGTVLGGILGHGLCTGFAVIGGRMVAQRISVKTVTLIGAFVFLFFAFSAFFMDPE
jgi:putative Ca2+/H+ antiporter (TMEM165/GDT1 family)